MSITDEMVEKVLKDARDDGFLSMADVRAILTAIESAGARVVPVEATEEMLDGMEQMYMPMGEMIAAWDGAIFASPFSALANPFKPE